jgi:hypothetical protein
MTLKKYLIVMAVATALSWLLFLFVTAMINPETTNWLGFALFYLTIFVSLSGTAALLGFVVRFNLMRKELAFQSVRIAFRQSFFFALFIVLLLLMMSQNLFSWLNLLLLLFIFAILELFMINYHRSH